MDLRQSLSLSSTWEVRGDLRAAVHVTTSSGVILDEPLASEKATTPLLLLPDSSPSSSPPPCQLDVGLSRLRGYVVSQLELTSSARTTELYERDEYVATAKGTKVESLTSGHEAQEKLYCCQHLLPPNTHLQELHIKLLSLRGRTEVYIEKLELVVSEDHGGVSSTDIQASSGAQIGGIHQLLEDLPMHNMPPFLKTLVYSLQTVNRKSSEAVSTSNSELPVELLEGLKQLRPSPPVGDDQELDRPSGGEAGGGKEGEGGKQKEGEVVEESGDSLEARLKHYVDVKFEEMERRLERQMEERMEELWVQLQERSHCTSQVTADNQLD